MSLRVTIELAGPPRGKGRGRAFVHNKTGRVTVATPAPTRAYEAQLRYAAQQHMAGRMPTTLPVRVDMTVAFAIPQAWSKKKKQEAADGQIWPCVKPDCDNTLKLCDALNGVVWADDKQVVVALVRKVYSARPGLTIEVETLRSEWAVAA